MPLPNPLKWIFIDIFGGALPDAKLVIWESIDLEGPAFLFNASDAIMGLIYL